MQPQLTTAGGTIYHEPDVSGRPTSGTLTMRDAAGTSIIAAQAVVVDGLNTTTSAPALLGATSIVLTSSSVAPVIGRSYQISDGTHAPEYVTCREWNAGTKTVYLASPLRYAYAAGSTVTGQRLTYAWTAPSGTKRGTYECTWTYVTATLTYVEIDTLDLVRVPIPWPILRPDALRVYLGPLADDVRQDVADQGDDFASLSTWAQEDVITDIRQRLPDGPERIRGWKAFAKPIAYRIVLNRARNGTGVPRPYADRPEAWLDLREQLYSSALTEALSVCGTYDADDDGTVTASEKKSSQGIVWVTR